jgi:hypothetical protein
MKEMMASLKAIGEHLNNKPVRAREDASSSRNWRGRPSSPESTRLRQSQESTRPRPSPETRRCFLCNKLGHLRRDCPDNKRQSQGRGQSFFKKRDRVNFHSESWGLVIPVAWTDTWSTGSNVTRSLVVSIFRFACTAFLECYGCWTTRMCTETPINGGSYWHTKVVSTL